MKTVHDPISLAGITLTSRFVRSATAERIAMDAPGDGERLGRLYAALAQGGVGLIVTGHIAVHPSGKVNPLMAGLFTETQAAEWRIAVERAHEAGGRVFAQLNHAGGRSRPADDNTTACVSALPDRSQDPMTGEVLTDASITLLLRAFVETAQRAKAAGFDGIQLHAAHGYLVSQFLSPLANRRKDEWGGSIEGRSRFLLSLYRAVREAVGRDFPLGLKLGACDDDPLGLMVEETLALAKTLEKDGLDFVEVSGAF